MPISATPAQAQTPAEFYKGRTIEIGISSTVGGGYDAHARMLARHMGKYIPGNPTIVPKNIEGAGGLRLANLLYNTAPRDGTSFGTIYRATAFEPLFGNKAAQFDATQFTWIGSASSEVSLCVSWHASGIATFDDMLTKELVVAHSGAGADAYQFSRIINGVLGTRMRLIGGYRGGNEMLLAMERGEVGGRCGWSWSSVQATRREWIERKQVNLLIAARAEQASRAAGRAAGRGSREDRRAAQHPPARVRAPADRLSVPGAARRAGGSRRRCCARRSSRPWPIPSSWPTPPRRGWKSSRRPAARCKSSSRSFMPRLRRLSKGRRKCSNSWISSGD